MDDQKQQVAQRIQEANNILVTVSTNPSVDQLAACIGLTVALNKMGKHATAVFSGEVPRILEFLQPEKTIEKNTDSLRDFIIALDKSKADKLRYKVEDRVVKIFITPYRTSISDKDLEFSQGDFNVDVVLALGVHKQSDLDQAITSHGRILHDAVIMTMNNKPGGELGALNWLDPTGSSLSELAMQLLDMLDRNILDEQIATAMLTGIVAETERFSNAKTTPRTMSISAELMAAGANQQLVATKLEEPLPPVTTVMEADTTHNLSAEPGEAAAPPKPDDGTLEIVHDEPAGKPADEKQAEPEEPETKTKTEPEAEAPAEEAVEKAPEPAADTPQIHIDEHGALHATDKTRSADKDAKKDDFPPIQHHAEAPKMILEPPTLGGQLTASGMPDAYELLPSDPLTLPAAEAPLEHDAPAVGPTIMPPSDAAAPEPADNTEKIVVDTPTPLDPPPMDKPDAPSPLNPFAQEKTLSQLENDVHSNHVAAIASPATPPVQDLPAPSFNPSPVPAAPAFTPPTDPAPASSSVPEPPASEPDATVDENGHVTLQDARDAVAEAINGSGDQQSLPPIQALNSQPLGQPLNDDAATMPAAPAPAIVSPAGAPNAWDAPAPGTIPFQPAMPGPGQPAMPGMQQPMLPPAGQGDDPSAPPPVPPPMMPFK